MFIAMNRFKVIPGSQEEFERVWTTRDTHLGDVPGFIEFHLLRGSKHGPGRKPFASPIKAPVRTSRSISAIPSSRDLTLSRPSGRQRQSRTASYSAASGSSSVHKAEFGLTRVEGIGSRLRKSEKPT